MHERKRAMIFYYRYRHMKKVMIYLMIYIWLTAFSILHLMYIFQINELRINIIILTALFLILIIIFKTINSIIKLTIVGKKIIIFDVNYKLGISDEMIIHRLSLKHHKAKIIKIPNWAVYAKFGKKLFLYQSINSIQYPTSFRVVRCSNSGLALVEAVIDKSLKLVDIRNAKYIV